MKKLYELDASKEFDDVQSSAASSDDNFSDAGIIAGNFEGISGLGVENISEEEDQANVTSIQDMLSKLNTRSDEDMARALEEEEAARERYRQEEEERLRLAKEKFNRERYEKEQEVLRKKREQEAEEEARRLAEEEEAKKNSFGYKLKSMFANKKNKNEESKEEQKQTQPIESKIETIEVSKTMEIEDEHEYAPEPEDIMSSMENSENRNITSFEDELDGEMFELSDIEEQPIESKDVSELLESQSVEVKETSLEDNKKEIVDNSQEVIEEGKKSFLGSLFASKTKKEKPTKVKEKPVKEDTIARVDYDEPDWKYIATHDEMTGLLNIRAYTEDLARMNNKLGVIFFDINNLKYVNDNFTHEAGNKLIKGVCSVVSKYFGTENLYRIGGDEFVVLIDKPSKNEDDKVAELCPKVHNDLADMTKQDSDKIIYAVSIGYAFGDGKATKEEVVKAADIAMYQNKKAYKLSHKDLDMRGQKADVAPPDHDDLLTKEQKMLKGKIQDEHEKASKGSTQQIVREVQKRASEIEAIFIASPSFDHLFVITDIDDFLDIMDRSKQLIDYSYLYIVYSGGPQYYGADEYYKEVTHLFESIADALMSGKFRSEKEIQNIPGINIFKNIYV